MSPLTLLLVLLLGFLGSVVSHLVALWLAPSLQRLVRADHAETPAETSVDAAVRQAFTDVGLNPAAYADDFNLRRTGKLAEVLHHAADHLGIDTAMTTVGDVKRHLQAEDRR